MSKIKELGGIVEYLVYAPQTSEFMITGKARSD
jgi:hypothetical protein